MIKEQCTLGENRLKSAKLTGHLWIKATSLGKSGQFPATAQIKPGQMDFEITNLLGGVEGQITFEGDRMKATLRSEKPQESKGEWNGIPLSWAPALFLGAPPCPEDLELKASSLKIISDGIVEIQGSTDRRYHYTLDRKTEPGHVLLTGFEWQQSGIQKVVCDFDPRKVEKETFLLLGWNCHTSTGGELKAYWKDRRWN